MLKIQANNNYHTLTREYDTKSASPEHGKWQNKYEPGWNIKPQSYFLHDILDMHHFTQAYPSTRRKYLANNIYPWIKPVFMYRENPLDKENFKQVKGYKDKTLYTPFRNYVTIPNNTSTKLHKLPDRLKQDDIQCILGMKIISIKDNDDKYYNRGVATNLIYHSNLTSNFIGSGLLNTTVLSVVYITRQDGMINHDIYYSWCKETKLAFPEDLKHTELKNDKALSNIIMDRSIKNKHNNLSVIDSIRNKKEYVWYLPFDKWMMFSAGNVFSRPHKSSYKKPKGISTWKKRKIARRKETRR